MDIVFWSRCYGSRTLTTREVNTVNQILAALAAKRATSVEAERTAMDARLAAKCKREGIAP